MYVPAGATTGGVAARSASAPRCCTRSAFVAIRRFMSATRGWLSPYFSRSRTSARCCPLACAPRSSRSPCRPLTRASSAAGSMRRVRSAMLSNGTVTVLSCPTVEPAAAPGARLPPPPFCFAMETLLLSDAGDQLLLSEQSRILREPGTVQVRVQNRIGPPDRGRLQRQREKAARRLVMSRHVREPERDRGEERPEQALREPVGVDPGGIPDHKRVHQQDVPKQSTHTLIVLERHVVQSEDHDRGEGERPAQGPAPLVGTQQLQGVPVG